MGNINSSISLTSLLTGVRHKIVFLPAGQTVGELSITAVTSDSRNVGPGGLFVAVEGLGNDGHQYIKSAVENGCEVVVCSSGRVSYKLAEEYGVCLIEVSHTMETYALIASNFFGNPADKIRCIGITGTNGKTTCSFLLEQLLLELKISTGVIGTINNRYTTPEGVKKILATEFTTPEPMLLQAILAEMVEAKVECVVMEVSSHALTQSRVGGVYFEVAAFTNLSRDHLDYHDGMQDYFSAKKSLFSKHTKPGGVAVIPDVDVQLSEKNGEQANESLHAVCKSSCENIIYWGEQETADIRLSGYSSGPRETKVQLTSLGVEQTICSPLVGRFNVDNLLTVFAIGKALGLSDTDINKGLKGAIGAPGRLERVETGGSWNSQGAVVLIDYAHTPDALLKVLDTVKELPHRKLFCVFGCGGDRDRGKRPLMGEIAASRADFSIVTDDNPRTEEPGGIIYEILVGVEQAGVAIREKVWETSALHEEKSCVVIRDRQTAIDTAIRLATAEDIVVIAGKGHEPYQLTSQGKHFFNDYLEAQTVLFSWTAELVAKAVSGKPCRQADGIQLLGRVYTDSRLQESDGIFVALKGDNHDGHEFAQQAAENGAGCLVVEREIELPVTLQVHQVVVQDTTEALGDLAGFRRAAISAMVQQVVVGLTGSCGKTTVKEMVAAILQRKWPEGDRYPAGCVLKTQGNFNNLIGLPLSLLPIDVRHKAAVLEMGMNRPGELQRLAGIANPDISCITNIHGAHLEGLQTIEGVAAAKEELFQGTKENGLLIINLDDVLIRRLSIKYDNPKLTFAVEKAVDGLTPDVWAADIKLVQEGGLKFELNYADQTIPVTLNIAGEHNVSNALCAAAISLAAGADLEQISAGLGDFRPPDKRMQIVQGLSGVTILNDTYNANPASMAAGLKTVEQMAPKRSAAIIGDMLELGDFSQEAHFQIGELLARVNLDFAAVVGDFKEDVKAGALAAGFDENRIRIFAEKEAAVDWFNELFAKKKLGQGDVLLVKASRGLRFETIVAQLGKK